MDPWSTISTHDVLHQQLSTILIGKIESIRRGILSDCFSLPIFGTK